MTAMQAPKHPRHAGRTQPHEDAAIHVVEAILVAILILSGLIFMNLMARPSPQHTADTTQLHVVADDMARILEGSTVPVPGDARGSLDMAQWLDAIMIGAGTRNTSHADGNAVAAALDAFRIQITPAGLQSAVRFHNGNDTYVLSPPDRDVFPRGAAVAVSYVAPNWTMSNTTGTDLLEPSPLACQTASYLMPGDPWPRFRVGGVFPCSTVQQAYPPTGFQTRPRWPTAIVAPEWQDPQFGDRIPPWAPLGVWTAENDEFHFLVGLPGVAETPRHTYAIETVVWRGI